MRKHIRLIGTMSASVEHYFKALQFLKNNWDRFSFMDMISNYYPLHRINEAMERMRTWQEVKPALTFTGDCTKIRAKTAIASARGMLVGYSYSSVLTSSTACSRSWSDGSQ